MKIVKYVFIIIAILLLGSIGYVMLQPNSYDIKRSKVINAPISMVFNYIDEYKNYQDWGPWMEEDPSIKAIYPEKTKGIGASYSWKGKDAPGQIKTIAIENNKSIEQKIQFGDLDPSDVYWRFIETEGGTKVTWGMRDDHTPFMLKFFAFLSGGMDAMMGPMEEKGLNNIDREITKILAHKPTSKEYRISAIEMLELPKQHFVGYFHKSKITELDSLFQEYMPKVGVYAAKNNLTDYKPTAVYTKWDEKNNETEFYIGLISENLAPEVGMKSVQLPAGKAVKISKFGPFGKGDYEAHMEIEAYMKANKLVFNKYVWEIYINDPSIVKPEDVQTDIYYSLQ